MRREECHSPVFPDKLSVSVKAVKSVRIQDKRQYGSLKNMLYDTLGQSTRTESRSHTDHVRPVKILVDGVFGFHNIVISRKQRFRQFTLYDFSVRFHRNDADHARTHSHR